MLLCLPRESGNISYLQNAMALVADALLTVCAPVLLVVRGMWGASAREEEVGVPVGHGRQAHGRICLRPHMSIRLCTFDAQPTSSPLTHHATIPLFGQSPSILVQTISCETVIGMSALLTSM